ncbi:sensor histidine kinase [Geothrix sp. PMB-07]|uniref:sensor histidine kinase n=1 Tax=Geothrix sp. PMB-07 TaxID=3068640 RepID=UPI00274126AB|nr:ATP-binding protein [Geothrix sp. PMB-07]WLT33525.1 ATP-binding protein [Geothrix sp. PMB-07]
MGTESLKHSEGRTIRLWLWLLSGFYLAVGLSGWLPLGWRAADSGVLYLAYLGAKSVIECLLVFWAAQRLGLNPRLRRSLRITGCAFALSAFNALWLIPSEAGWLRPASASLAALVAFSTYLLGLAGILWMPTRKTRQSAWWEFLFDLAAAVMGLSVALALVITMPQVVAAADPVTRTYNLAYGGAQTLMLIGLNVLVLRGAAHPSRRAFWLFVTMVFLNLFTLVVYQLESSGGTKAAYPFGDLLNGLTSVCTLWTAAAFRFDPIREDDQAPGPDWFSTFNPLPLMATAGIALLLLYGAFVPGSWNLRLLVPVMVLQVVFILARLFLTSRENARLHREEALHHKQRQEEKVAAVRRLAGGMAHWYNNLLTAVVGRAEMGSATTGLDPSLREGFKVILEAADRAGRLTHQLLSYGGGSFLSLQDCELGEAVRCMGDRLVPTLPSNISLQVATGNDPLLVPVDLPRLESVVRELAMNAVAAMPQGGNLRITARQEQVRIPMEACPLPVGKGARAVIEVVDTGIGIPPHQVALLFDPFFTTQPMHAAAGLGLAEVFGVVAEHGGGLTVQSTPGLGTRFAIYLPLKG